MKIEPAILGPFFARSISPARSPLPNLEPLHINVEWSSGSSSHRLHLYRVKDASLASPLRCADHVRFLPLGLDHPDPHASFEDLYVHLHQQGAFKRPILEMLRELMELIPIQERQGDQPITFELPHAVAADGYRMSELCSDPDNPATKLVGFRWVHGDGQLNAGQMTFKDVFQDPESTPQLDPLPGFAGLLSEDLESRHEFVAWLQRLGRQLRGEESPPNMTAACPSPLKQPKQPSCAENASTPSRRVISTN